jgi:hypothetical protein
VKEERMASNSSWNDRNRTLEIFLSMGNSQLQNLRSEHVI